MHSCLTVNGQNVSIEEDISLLEFLRENLHLTSAKDGCSEGACGTCTVLVEGKPIKACTVRVSDLNGKHVTTVEGLTQYEKDVYTYSFGKAGAVQCGFCIPGMVICAKALLAETLHPTEQQIRYAIRNNYCRCTGYAKLIKAIGLAAEIFRGETEIETEYSWKIGERIPRVDVKDKVTGTGKYPDDIYMDGMLEAVAVRSSYPRAKVLAIDKTKALEKDGVVTVLTAEDIPGNVKVGHLKQDWDTMIATGKITRYVGDVIALVVAEDRKTAREAAKLVKVDYEVLPFVSSPQEAMKEDAPKVHEEGNLLGHTHVDRGDTDAALKASKYVVSGHFSTPWTEHAFLEPECAVATPYGDGVKIWSADQGVYDTRRETAPMLGLPEEKVLVENCYVGGGFGGKEDVTVQHLCALAAFITKRPCKMKLTRSESLAVHPKRHPMEMDFTLGCNEKGQIQALDAKIIADTGAYASLGLPVLQRACTHASGPYNYQNFRIDGYAWYTNNPPAGAFRGFGVTQSCFAIESLLNLMADKIGISHWDIRYINAIRPGQVLPNGQIADDSTGLVETLEAVKDLYFANKYTGIACAMKNAGVGVGIPDTGRVKLEIKDEKVIIHCGGSCIGQGLCTVLKQVVCDVTGLDGEKVVEEKANTFNAPDSGTTSGSRHTTISGEAARRASVELKKELENHTLKELEGREFYAEYLAKTDAFGSTVPNPKSHIAYGFATQMCILDPQTRKISKLVAAHEVGKAINPTSIEGQIEGGVIMSMGFALREKYILENCVPKSKFGSLGLFRADEVPEIETVIVEKKGLEVACGGIGIGEITAIPTAPAIADAYYRLDGQFRTSLPLNDTPYEPKKKLTDYGSGKCLNIDTNALCIGCKACERACSTAFRKTTRTSYSCISVQENNNSGSRPIVCTQCGKCAQACPEGAITKNNSGVWIINRSKCTNCGKCAQACPFSLIVCTENTTTKCIACGLCEKACPTGVLKIREKGDSPE